LADAAQIRARAEIVALEFKTARCNVAADQRPPHDPSSQNVHPPRCLSDNRRYALELIEFPGKLGKEGKRPRFRFTTRQQRIASYLPEIDAVLSAAGNDQTPWL
jgi:hypothetical protein